MGDVEPNPMNYLAAFVWAKEILGVARKTVRKVEVLFMGSHLAVAL